SSHTAATSLSMAGSAPSAASRSGSRNDVEGSILEMNPGMSEEGAKAVSGFVSVFKNEPLSLALIAMNVCLLLFFYILLTTVADQREREVNLLYTNNKEVRELLAKCVVPEKRSSLDNPELIGPPAP